MQTPIHGKSIMQRPKLDIRQIRELRESIAGAIEYTPMLRAAAIESELGDDRRVLAKLEFLQRTGTFKARGALATLMSLPDDQLEAGVTAVSAGNHAIATAYAASVAGTSARVAMIRSASPARVDACRRWGAEVVFADNVHDAFEAVEEIRRTEGRYLVHPFEGPHVAAGTGTLGLEIAEQCHKPDALIVPVGGGGLLAGVSNAVRQLHPGIRIFGVEPEGADTMSRSFEAGTPCSIDEVRTIADSLGAPYALPYSYGMCRDNVDTIVRVTDRELRASMRFLFGRMNIAVEPACAASTAALFGPLRSELAGCSVVLLFCGSNTDWETWSQQVQLDE